MSAILEALKKSQAHRQQFSVPQPQSRLSAIHRPTRRLPWIILALLFLPALAIALILLRKPTPEITAQPGPVPDARPVAPVNKPHASTQPASTASSASNSPAQPETTLPDTASRKGYSNASQALQAPAPSTAESAADVKDEAQAVVRQAVDPADTSTDESILQPFELPPTLRQQAAALQINVIQYNEDGEKSWVLVNMHKYREGDQLEGDFYLKAIRPQSLLLQYDRFLFEWPIQR